MEEVFAYARGEKNLYCAVKDQKDLKDYIISTPYENIDLIPSSTLMSAVEYELFTKWQREFILRKGLKGTVEFGRYDYILIASPPTLGGWVMNVLCASDTLVIPVGATPWGLFGLDNMFEFLEAVRPIDLEWSPDNNMPIMAYKRSSRSAKEYGALTKGIEERTRSR